MIEGSAGDVGGTNGQCPAVEFGPSAANVTMTGVQIGDPTDWQAEPILADAGASNIVAVNNVFAGNVLNTIVDNSGEPSNLFGPNGGDTSPGYAWYNTDKVFGIGGNTSNQSIPGLIIRETSNSGEVRSTLQNPGPGRRAPAGRWRRPTRRTPTCSAASTTTTARPMPPWGSAPGPRTACRSIRAAAGPRAPLDLIGGSSAGVNVNPFLQLAIAYSAAGTPLFACNAGTPGLGRARVRRDLADLRGNLRERRDHEDARPVRELGLDDALTVVVQARFGANSLP